MAEVLLNENHIFSMFPVAYAQSTNEAILRTNHVRGIQKLYDRIKNLHERIYRIKDAGNPHPGGLYVELDTLLFELKAIAFFSGETSLHDFEYEPVGNDRKGKSVDLRFFEGGMQYLVELKATNPHTKESRIPVEHFSADTLHANPMYYNWISSSRSHLLEFLFDTEKKLSNYSDKHIGVLCVYKNFYIEEDELEALWHFYVTGTPHPGDAFGDMMQHELQRKGIEFGGSIDKLWALSFPQYGFDLLEDGFSRLHK